MLSIQTFTFNPFYENTYVLYDKGGEALIIDAGCYSSEEEQALVSFVDAHKLRPTALWNTHMHLDHLLGSAFVQVQWGLRFLIPEGEQSMLERSSLDAPLYGFTRYKKATPDDFLRPGKAQWGTRNLSILGVPGHSPDHLAFYFEQEGFLVSGDVLFREGIGRTDLPGGDMDTLLASIHNTLFALPDDTTIYSGHGATTTIGHEKVHNPFLK